jgi:hypothetical protein
LVQIGLFSVRSLNFGTAWSNVLAVDDGAATEEGGPERRDTSNLTLALTIGYVRARLGEEGVTILLGLAGEKRSPADLCDEGRWSTQEQKLALLEAAARVLDDPEVGRRIGETVLEQQTGTALRLMLRTVGSPAALCRSVAKAAASSPPTTPVKPSPSAATRR